MLGVASVCQPGTRFLDQAGTEEAEQLIVAFSGIVLRVVQRVEGHRVDHAHGHLGAESRGKAGPQLACAGLVETQEVVVHDRQQRGATGQAVADAGNGIPRDLVFQSAPVAEMRFLQADHMAQALRQGLVPGDGLVDGAFYQFQKPGYADIEE